MSAGTTRLDRVQQVWAGASHRPPIGTRRLFALATGGAFLACGILAAISVALGPSNAQHSLAILGLALLCVVGGVTLAVLGRHLRCGLYQLILPIGTILISTAAYLRGGGAASINLSFLYLFPAIGSAFFFSWSRALLQLVFIEVCSYVTFSAVDLHETDVIIGQGSILLVATTVHLLTLVANTADRDALTGLGNRRRFDARLGHAMLSSIRTGAPLSVVLLDFDGFKEINDTGGHAVGDQVLQAVTSAWKKYTKGNVLCRLGGDEFALLLPGHTADQAAVVADKLRELARPHIGCSAGVAQFCEGDSQTNLVSRADSALYLAKNNGRAATVAFGTAHQKSAALERAVGDSLIFADQ
ncbi:diguanylate cyclase (GGDEF) domain-containing protein [Frankineae bacterium MT45]|nr:diguanylate cyclase (GGDEF) domain-containing protein [Frankineae bacterium MT45]